MKNPGDAYRVMLGAGSCPQVSVILSDKGRALCSLNDMILEANHSSVIHIEMLSFEHFKKF